MEQIAVSLPELFLAAIAATAIALTAHRRRQLDTSGAIAASVIGPALVATGGWWLGALLISFFVSSALLPNPEHESPSRTWQQVVANGGPALVFGTVSLITQQHCLLLGAASSIAATTADTWATEIGRAIGGTPWSMRSSTRVPPGTSGAVTVAGLLASATGAALIAILALVLSPLAETDGLGSVRQSGIIAICGVLGSTADTVLGATLQARFSCIVCGTVSEDASDHHPGHHMRRTTGIRWMTNNMVNLLSATIAGLAAIVLWR